MLESLTLMYHFDAPNVENITDTFIFPKSQGDFVSTGVTSHDQFTSTLDGDPVVLTFNDFTVNAGHTVTTSQRCKGLYLNILGNLTVNGTISMTARGAKATGSYVTIDKFNPVIYYSSDVPFNVNDSNAFNYYQLIYPTGGVGVANNAYKCSTGAAGKNGACGAGGNTYRKGGNGTSFSGGAGAGGFAYNWNGGKTTSGMTAGAENGGQGGNGGSGQGGCRGGAGAGNPSGGGNKATAGTGGLLIIKVFGNIVFGTNGAITSNGSRGGNGVATSPNNYNGTDGGAGSGGGAIHIFHAREFLSTDKAKVKATGGAHGTNYTSNVSGSCNGGAGTINIVQMY